LLLIFAILCMCQCRNDEQTREGLLALYNSNGGYEVPSLWIHNKGWGSAGHFCTWEGVYCDVHGFIATLDQNAGGLLGTIPPQIGLLADAIGSIQLNRNTIRGTIPPEIGRLTQLVQLDLQQNQIVGTIPSSIANLTKLQMFWVSYNQMTGSVDLSMKPVLDQCAAYQPLGCRMTGNPFKCPIPGWVPVECNMLCVV